MNPNTYAVYFEAYADILARDESSLEMIAGGKVNFYNDGQSIYRHWDLVNSNGWLAPPREAI